MLSRRTCRSLLNALGCFLAAPESVLLFRSTELAKLAIKLGLGGAELAFIGQLVAMLALRLTSQCKF